MLPRRTLEWLNCAAVFLAVGVSTLATVRSAPAGAAPTAQPGQVLPAMGEPLPLAAGGRALSDATGALIPLASYRRIASGSLLADPILLALCSPEQIVSFSARAPDARDAHRYAGKPSVDAHRTEELLSLRPDLVLVSSLGDHAFVRKLRDAGLVVFDLGPMQGVHTFLRNLLAIGWLTGRPEAAQELAWQFRERLEAIARHLPPEERRSALYLGIHGGRLYGGTRGSSYHDVLRHAGLTDAAAQAYQGWPSYDPEQLLLLDPEVVVTQTGMRGSLCERRELSGLRACSAHGQVVEIDARLLNDAGFSMLEASERIHAAAYAAGRDP